MPRLHPLFTVILLLCAACLARAGEPEVQLTNEQFKKLDQFESFALQKADKIFNGEKKEYKQAGAEYEAFVLDNPRSKVLPYALLRKARCIQLSNKRNAAIKEYQELIDFFPDADQFSGAAMYYIGQCHWENGDQEKALKAWAQLAEHPTFSKHFLAASALNMLAENMLKQNQTDKAIGYFKQVAIDFRTANPDAARHAIFEQVVPYYVRTSPDEPKLRDFYVKARGFENDPHKIEEDATKDNHYWTKVREYIERLGQFTDLQADLRKTYFGYWAQQMAGKFPEWDDYQLDAANYQFAADGDATRFASRMDDQFTKYQKDGDYARVVKWIQAYATQKNKVQEYYAKLDFSKMPTALIRHLIAVLYDNAKDPALAKNVFQQARLGEMTDQERTEFSHFLWQKDGDLVKTVCASMKDPAYGQMELLRYYHWKQDGDKGLPLCDLVKGVPDYAKEALWKKAEFYHWKGQMPEAIAAYKEADNPPHNLFRISECFAKLGKLDQAVQQLQQIQNFFQEQAPDAALRVAYIYRDAGMKDKFESALRVVLKKYPKSGQSSQAHQELEKMGARIGGGVDAEQ